MAPHMSLKSSVSKLSHSHSLAQNRCCGAVQAHDPPARPQGLEELLHLLAAQQVASHTPEGEEGEPNAQQQADNEAYTQSKLYFTQLCHKVGWSFCLQRHRSFIATVIAALYLSHYGITHHTQNTTNVVRIHIGLAQRHCSVCIRLLCSTDTIHGFDCLLCL